MQRLDEPFLSPARAGGPQRADAANGRNKCVLQRMMHSACRVVCDLLPREHMTAAHESVHFLQSNRELNSNSACYFIGQSTDEHLPTSGPHEMTASVPDQASSQQQ